MTYRESFRELERIVAHGDLRNAIAYLNGLTEHRFTALYRFDNETLRNLYFFDRENPERESTPDIPVMASYCVFVRDRKKRFAIADSLDDGRVTEHPKRREMRSYCGVPLLDEDGRMFGSICHFDYQPREISAANVELMEAIAPMIRRTASSIVPVALARP